MGSAKSEFRSGQLDVRGSPQALPWLGSIPLGGPDRRVRGRAAVDELPLAQRSACGPGCRTSPSGCPRNRPSPAAASTRQPARHRFEAEEGLAEDPVPQKAGEPEADALENANRRWVCASASAVVSAAWLLICAAPRPGGGRRSSTAVAGPGCTAVSRRPTRSKLSATAGRSCSAMRIRRSSDGQSIFGAEETLRLRGFKGVPDDIAGHQGWGHVGPEPVFSFGAGARSQLPAGRLSEPDDASASASRSSDATDVTTRRATRDRQGVPAVRKGLLRAIRPSAPSGSGVRSLPRQRMSGGDRP